MKTTKIKTRLDNGVIGILDHSRFGTALFTRLQLWTMLGEDSELREWNRQLEAAIPSRICCEV
jgi:hypothetical protein